VLHDSFAVAGCGHRRNQLYYKYLSIFLPRKQKGFFEREDDVSIIWDKIESVGKDTVLVNTESLGKIHNENESFLRKFLNFFLY
jgi:hypothetical protein